MPFTGEIRTFAFGQTPAGWLPCAGQLLPINKNQALFALLGNVFGGDAKTNFALPDLRGRAALGASNEQPLGQPGGEEAHVLSSAEMPPHSHQAQASGLAGNSSSPAGALLANATMWTAPDAPQPLRPETVGPVGGNAPHGNMQPFLALTMCICTNGLFPDDS
jgi:microcystin-dependent protein